MISRRKLVFGSASILFAFDPIGRTWVNAAHARTRPGLETVPNIEGDLVFEPALLREFSVDMGSYQFATPLALLQPATVRDIAKLVRFCSRLRIPVSARGQGHTTDGQSLAEGGLIIDMSQLSEIYAIGPDSVEVDAGLTWKDLVEITVPLGLTPPVLTGYTELSIGGTLSVGGISVGYDRGSQGDHVSELEVVTGKGQIVRCSERKRRDLFLACLAGLGQYGIITKAVLNLRPAPDRVRLFILPYIDNGLFFRDIRTLLERSEFNDVYAQWALNEAGGWTYLLFAQIHYHNGEPVDEAHLLRELDYIAPAIQVIDLSYLESVLAVDAQIGQLKEAGLWDNRLKPWADVWVPGCQVEEFIGDQISQLTPADVGHGFVLLFPHRRSRFKRPLFRLPDDEWVYLYDILTNHTKEGQDQAFLDYCMERNRDIYESAKAIGGTRYPIGSVEFTQSDWENHYGKLMPIVRRLKIRFDPHHLLARGVGIFN